MCLAQSLTFAWRRGPANFIVFQAYIVAFGLIFWLLRFECSLLLLLGQQTAKTIIDCKTRFFRKNRDCFFFFLNGSLPSPFSTYLSSPCRSLPTARLLKRLWAGVCFGLFLGEEVPRWAFLKVTVLAARWKKGAMEAADEAVSSMQVYTTF